MTEATSMPKLVQALQNARSAKELAAECSLSVKTVQRYLRVWHEAHPRLVHVADWNADHRGNRTIAMWLWGDKPDRKRPRTNAPVLRKAAPPAAPLPYVHAPAGRVQ